METSNKSSTHWSTHPRKLPVMLAVALAVLSAVYLFLMQTVISRFLSPAEGSAQGMAWYFVPQLLLLTCYALVAVAVLRAQAGQGLADRALNRVGWTALPGFVVAVALILVALLQPHAGDNRGLYLRNSLSTTLAGIAAAALPVLVAAMLLPVFQPKVGLTVGALIVMAVLLASELGKYAVVLILSGPQADLWPSAVLYSLQPLTYGLVAAMLFVAVRRRLWDALGLQWALLFALGWLSRMWVVAIGSGLQLWQVLLANLSPWLLLALASLYCLWMWDRGVSPADPFKALAQRIRALAGHFLPT